MKTLLIEFNQDSEYIRYKLTDIPKGMVKVNVFDRDVVLRTRNPHLTWINTVRGLVLFEDNYTLIMEK